MAGAWLADRYNVDGHVLFDFDVYALAGDGCMMEGVASEAASLAGHLALSKLCWIYDSNRVTIEGHTDIAFTEEVASRFIAYGWNVTTVADANDLDSVARAFHTFRTEHERPTLIVVHSHIGYGSPVEDSPKAHGEPRGRRGAGGEAVLRPTRGPGLLRTGRRLRRVRVRTGGQREAGPGDLAVHAGRGQGVPPRSGGRARPYTTSGPARGLGEGVADLPARRRGSGHPRLFGSGAQRPRPGRTLARRRVRGSLALDQDPSGLRECRRFPGRVWSGRNLHFGVREHASAAFANGVAVTKLRPYWSGFLIFSDYARGAMRLSALMEIPVIHIFTHDSIGVGEDGPTHQPVEQLASLRAVPGLLVFRPGDANEVVETWRHVMGLRHEPAVLVLSSSRRCRRSIDPGLDSAPCQG